MKYAEDNENKYLMLQQKYDELVNEIQQLYGCGIDQELCSLNSIRRETVIMLSKTDQLISKANTHKEISDEAKETADSLERRDRDWEARKYWKKWDEYYDSALDAKLESNLTLIDSEQLIEKCEMRFREIKTAYENKIKAEQKAKEEAMIKAAQEKAAAEKAEKERKLQEQIAAENANKFSPDVVLVAGSFSAGKSEFINSLIDSEFCLNTDISACTSVPTLITKANNLSFKAIKNNDEEIEISEQIFSTLHHSDNSGDEYKLIKITAPLKVNASFLDSPGYDAKSDMAHFLELAPRVSKAIWVIDIAAAATLKAQDLELLNQLNHTKLYVLLNKVDLFYEDVKSLLDFIDMQLKSANINALGIASYDSISCEQKDFLRMSIDEFLA